MSLVCKLKSDIVHLHPTQKHREERGLDRAAARKVARALASTKAFSAEVRVNPSCLEPNRAVLYASSISVSIQTASMCLSYLMLYNCARAHAQTTRTRANSMGHSHIRSSLIKYQLHCALLQAMVHAGVFKAKSSIPHAQTSKNTLAVITHSGPD